MLEHAQGLFDGVFFYDDQSDDETTPYIASTVMNCSGAYRPDDVPSFKENEGAFRGAAWSAFEEIVVPQLGDWICVVDCDEVLVGDESANPSEIRTVLERVIHAAGSMVAVDLAIPEVFGYDTDGCPLIRTDGFWGAIHAPRLFAYRPGGQYFQGDFGVPAVPNYVMGGRWFSTEAIWLMHYGYASVDDQAAKYERYTGHNGHSNAHVESIIGQMNVRRWEGPYLSSMRKAVSDG